MSDKEFDGQVAVVTGGGVGIGFAIAKLFAERGATASIWDIDGEAAAAAAKRLKEAGLKAHSQQLDVTDEKQILAARDATLADCGQIDILVNNAGLYPEGTIQEMTREAWDRVFAVNVTGPFFLMRALMEHMKARKYGRMVNIVTVDAYMPKQTKPHYAASKAALLSVMKTYAIELAPHGILVNGVSPGAVGLCRRAGADGRIHPVPGLQAEHVHGRRMHHRVGRVLRGLGLIGPLRAGGGGMASPWVPRLRPPGRMIQGDTG
jgi:NAD(P)-dependent dehydrogenase (short-subunit alcohol dehydrogenase family)